MKILFTTVAIVLQILMSGIVHAEDTSFGVSPPRINVTGLPGEVLVQKIKLDNPLKRPSVFKLELMGAVVKPAGLTDVPMSSLPPDHIARHVVLESPTVTVPSKSSKEVLLTITIPQSARGTQYARIDVSRGSDKMDATERSSEYKQVVGLGMQPGIGLYVQVTVKGTVTYSCKVVSAQSERASANQPPMIKVKLQNTGNGVLEINPMLALIDSTGAAGVRLRTTYSVNIAPGATGTLDFVSDGRDIKAGNYKGILSIGGNYGISPSQISVSIR